jgi:hypothetical protein
MAQVFLHPKESIGQEIGLAGDMLTAKQMAEIFTKVSSFSLSLSLSLSLISFFFFCLPSLSHFPVFCCPSDNGSSFYLQQRGSGSAARQDSSAWPRHVGVQRRTPKLVCRLRCAIAEMVCLCMLASFLGCFQSFSSLTCPTSFWLFQVLMASFVCFLVSGTQRFLTLKAG